MLMTTNTPNNSTLAVSVFRELYTFVIFVLTSTLIHTCILHHDWHQHLIPIIGNALVYHVTYSMVSRYSPVILSFSWMIIPYFIFAIGWLNPFVAASFCAVLMICYLRIYRYKDDHDVTPLSGNNNRLQSLLGFVLVLLWVAVSGAGGYGYQAQDYIMHNGRLMDLVEYPWPVKYSDSLYLVCYTAYYLPAALIGKITSYATANTCMHFWTLFGAWLALRWLIELTQQRYTILLAIVLIFFGGWDIVGLFLDDFVAINWPSLLTNSDPLNFWTSAPFGFFLGNYVSNSFNLFWAPHQTIVGWVFMGLMTYLFLHRRVQHAGLAYALLALWSPMVLLGTLPYMFMAIFSQGMRSFKQSLSFENLTGGLSIVVMLGLYYTSGTALTNPSGWIWHLGNDSVAGNLLLLHILSWGIYATLILCFAPPQGKITRLWFGILLCTLLLLPLYNYGTYNDLLCRSIAPSMFLLSVYCCNAIQQLFSEGKHWRASVLLIALLPGTYSAVLQLSIAHQFSYRGTPGIHVQEYGAGWQFMGSTDSAFYRYFLR